MVEQVLPVRRLQLTTHLPAGEELRQVDASGGGGRHHKGQEGVRGKRREESAGRNTLGVRLQKRTVSRHVEEKGIQPCKDQQVSRVTVLPVCSHLMKG